MWIQVESVEDNKVPEHGWSIMLMSNGIVSGVFKVTDFTDEEEN